MAKNIIILGAGGRDFHTFISLFRDDKEYNVVAFTAAQIPGIANKVFPPTLAGSLYPQGIPIYDESELPSLIKKLKVDETILAYSDLLYDDVMSKASISLSNGSDFRLISPERTMIISKKPAIAITASRTGAGKSTISRKIVSLLREKGINFCIIRHPMAYGDFEKTVVVKMNKLEDVDKLNLTIEEKEEFENYLKQNITCFEGIDYFKIVKEAEKEFDLIIWDGGNNDAPFIKPNLWITAVDPFRLGHEKSYPGEINVRLADVIVITKINTASPENVKKTRENVLKLNQRAEIIEAAFEIEVDNPKLIEGKTVLVVEDGPTVTHGQVPYGAGYIAALNYKAKEIVDPKEYAKGIFHEIYQKYQHIGKVLPTIGYNPDQLKDLEATINSIKCDAVVLGTTSDLSRYLKINKPVVKVNYYLREKGSKTLDTIIDSFIRKYF
jgi:predicted GTPase